MYFLQKCRIWTKMNVVLVNQSQGEEDPVVPATQPNMLPAFSRTVTAHFSRLCYFCSLILNFPFGGVCWEEKAGAGQRVTAVSKQHTVNFPLVVCFLSGHTAPATWFDDIRDFPVITGGLANCLTAPSLPGRGAGQDLTQNQQKSVDRTSLTDTSFKSDSINRQICIKWNNCSLFKFLPYIQQSHQPSVGMCMPRA